jgi:hypothetical protein
VHELPDELEVLLEAWPLLEVVPPLDDELLVPDDVKPPPEVKPPPSPLDEAPDDVPESSAEASKPDELVWPDPPQDVLAKPIATGMLTAKMMVERRPRIVALRSCQPWWRGPGDTIMFG